MIKEFSHWSVIDLPTFVHMCKMARIPTVKYGVTEYELVSLDIPSIMGKLEVYDKMRPNPQALQGSNPDISVKKELSDWHKSHLLDGTPHVFESVREAEQYWHGQIDKFNEGEKKVYDRIGETTKGGLVKTVDEVLGVYKSTGGVNDTNQRES